MTRDDYTYDLKSGTALWETEEYDYTEQESPDQTVGTWDENTMNSACSYTLNQEYAEVTLSIKPVEEEDDLSQINVDVESGVFKTANKKDSVALEKVFKF